MTYTHDQLETILALLIARIERAGGRITEKVGWFWTAIHYIVIVLTLGSNRRFKTHYYTTFGPVIGVPVGWESRHLIDRISTLEHELEHIEQCKWFGFDNAWVGLIPYGFLYLLFPLPVGFAYFRWRFERAAYVHGINVEMEFRAQNSIDPSVLRSWLIDNAVRQLTTGAYAWTATLWPGKKRVKKWFESQVRDPKAFLASTQEK